MTLPAIIGMYPDLSPNQMQVVASREIDRHCPNRLVSVIRHVEIMLGGIEIPAVAHRGRQHLGYHRERIGVVDVPHSLLNVGNCGDLSHVVRFDAYEAHQTRVPHMVLFRHVIFWSSHPANFEITLRPPALGSVTVTTWQAPSAVWRCSSSAAAARPSRGRHPRCGVLTCFRSAPHLAARNHVRHCRTSYIQPHNFVRNEGATGTGTAAEPNAVSPLSPIHSN